MFYIVSFSTENTNYIDLKELKDINNYVSIPKRNIYEKFFVDKKEAKKYFYFVKKIKNNLKYLKTNLSNKIGSEKTFKFHFKELLDIYNILAFDHNKVEKLIYENFKVLGEFKLLENNILEKMQQSLEYRGYSTSIEIIYWETIKTQENKEKFLDIYIEKERIEYDKKHNDLFKLKGENL